jgi:hypothetical protein
MERRRSKRFLTLKDRLALYANEVREGASLLPPGIERDILIKKARQADTASQLEDWAEAAGKRRIGSMAYDESASYYCSHEDRHQRLDIPLS